MIYRWFPFTGQPAPVPPKRCKQPSATWISRTTTTLVYVTLPVDRNIEHGGDITDRYTEKARRSYPRFVRELGILLARGSPFGVLRHLIPVLVAIELIADERANLPLSVKIKTCEGKLDFT